jgi:hypothetical protein
MEKGDVMDALVFGEAAHGAVSGLAHEFEVSFFGGFLESAVLIGGPVADLAGKVVLTLDVGEFHAAVHDAFVDFVVAAGNNLADGVEAGWVVWPACAQVGVVRVFVSKVSRFF